MTWPPLKTLHCWWAKIASAIDLRSIIVTNPVSWRGRHSKQFRHIERLIRGYVAVTLALSRKRRSLGGAWHKQLCGGESLSNLNANGFFKRQAALSHYSQTWRMALSVATAQSGFDPSPVTATPRHHSVDSTYSPGDHRAIGSTWCITSLRVGRFSLDCPSIMEDPNRNIQTDVDPESKDRIMI